MAVRRGETANHDAIKTLLMTAFLHHKRFFSATEARWMSPASETLVSSASSKAWVRGSRT
jgi:hypothetical protein